MSVILYVLCWCGSVERMAEIPEKSLCYKEEASHKNHEVSYITSIDTTTLSCELTSIILFLVGCLCMCLSICVCVS